MRKAVVALLVVVVVVGMASALWRYLRAEQPRAELRFSEVSGKVRLDRQDGPEAARRGTRLRPEDRVTTGPESRAVLTLGQETHIRLGPESTVQVTGLDDAGVSLELENGALQATVRPDSGAVRVENRGRGVLATNGEFEVGVSDDVLQVSATRGTLSLTGLDETRLEEGTQAVVLDRHAEIGQVPEELLLAVAWPEAGRTRARTTRVTGRTVPRARVLLSGSFGEAIVRADEQGEFSAEVPLGEGDNPVRVEAIDALGNRAEVAGMLQTRDTVGPSFRGGVEYER